MPGQHGGNAKRKFKKLLREQGNSTSALTQIMNVLRHYGYKVDMPEEVPNLLNQIFSTIARGTPPAQSSSPQYPTTQNPPHPQDFPTLDLEEVDEGDEIPDPTESSWNPQTTETTPGSIHASTQATPPNPAPPPAGIDPSMIELFQQRQQQMLDRIAQTGIRHRGGGAPHPSEGQKLDIHPAVQPKAPISTGPSAMPKPTTTSKTPVVPLPTLPEGEFEEDQNFDPSSRVNPFTGLSIEEQRAIIEKATGKKPEPPKPGRPNTLKP
jgi:hypothetical protein